MKKQRVTQTPVPPPPGPSPAPGPSAYPPSVLAALWDARTVWDLQLSGNAGCQATSKKFGVDPLPVGCDIVSGVFIYVRGTVVFDGWDFSSLLGGVYVQSGASAVFTNCLFKCGTSTLYNLEVAGVARCSFCTFNGSSNNISASNYIVRSGGSLLLSRCVSSMAQNDTGKSQGHFTADHCLYLPTAANPDAHLDGHQMDQGDISFTGCLFDARGNANIATPLNNYIRIESNGGSIIAVSVNQCICIGQSASGGLDPFEIRVNPYAIGGVRFVDNLWQRGSGGHYFYPGVPAGVITAWSNNIDFDTGVLYDQPV